MIKHIQEGDNMFEGTTILAVKKNNTLAIAGDGQVTMNQVVVKNSARKIRKIYNGEVVAGFAGAVADALTLFDKFEKRLNESRGNIEKAAINLVKEWRTDKILRRLEALLIVGNKEHLYLISGTGEIIEPDDGIVAIGSGAYYALAAARALNKFTELSVKDIAFESLKIASDICIYTNDNIVVEEIE